MYIAMGLTAFGLLMAITLVGHAHDLLLRTNDPSGYALAKREYQARQASGGRSARSARARGQEPSFQVRLVILPYELCTDSRYYL